MNISVLFSAEEIDGMSPVVCVAKGRKELVECKKSKKKTYKRYVNANPTETVLFQSPFR